MSRVWEQILARRSGRFLVTVLMLVVAGLLLRPLERPLWQAVKAGQPELNLAELEGALGQGILVGVLGGFRAVVADFLWIQTNHYWQQRNRPKTETMIQIVTRLDPRPDFFWFNGARMLAYDIPNWRIRELGGYDAVPQSVQDQIDYEQAMRGIALLEEARSFHPDNPRFVLEIAQIHNFRLKDTETAAKWFYKASQMPRAPHFAARIYAELLRRLDRPKEAYEFLRQHHKSLPNWEDPMAEIVLERIRDLEEELRIPLPRRYFPRR